MGDLCSISGLGRFPGEGKGYPFQYSGLENPVDYSSWSHKELDITEGFSVKKSQENNNNLLGKNYKIFKELRAIRKNKSNPAEQKQG